MADRSPSETSASAAWGALLPMCGSMDDGAMTAKDVASLPHRLQASARIDANGEVSWPLDKARDAISELAKSGRVVLGLDMRDYDAEGLFIEVAWSV